ncbi:unnamed protein product [Adineta steineri]|nr:unnamed protein product [Adineta steineri]
MVALCDLAETTTTDAIDSFLETRLVVSQLSDESLFLSQIQVIVESFQADTQTAFGREIDVIDVLKQGNLLVSSLGTSNYFTAFYDYYYRDFPVYSTSEQFLDQNDAWENCQVSSKGTNLVAATDTQNIAHWIPGWRFGCYIDEALFASTLECYYNITCLSLLRNVYSLPLEVQVLKVTNDSRFAVDTTIGTIVRQLFIEDLAATFNFTGYFMACLPSQCIYTIVERRSIITVITTVVGLLGGLTKAIDLVVPRAVRFIRRHGHKWKRIIKVKPKINTNTTVTC